MAEVSHPPMTVDLEPVQLVGPEDRPRPNPDTAVNFPRRRCAGSTK